VTHTPQAGWGIYKERGFNTSGSISPPNAWGYYPFHKQTSSLCHDDALWCTVCGIVAYHKLDPTSSREPAPIQNYTRINFGGVGFIRCGQFHLLFSAGCPLGGRRLGIDVPLKFEQLDIGNPVFRQPRRPGYRSTGTVRKIGADFSTSVAMTPYVQFVGSSPSHISNTCQVP